MHAFVTIGSTRFDLLVKEILSVRTLEALKSRGCTTLTVQCGNSAFEQASLIAKGETTKLSVEGIQVELWKFKPALTKEYEKADLVISHAGSGTIIEILRLPRPLIAVPNPTLLHNHQEELAQELEAQKYLTSSTVE
ncbi:N-acetylglucosaminyldiphosphodolichol N-acetylglucosaminyltransferase catalytic subunit alg13 [Leucoagaricus gongylophorus]